MDLTLLTINQEELDELRTRLDAVLDNYRGLDTSGGDIDSMSLSRAETCPDLATSEEFDEMVTEDWSPDNVDLLFDYPNVGTVRLQISTARGSIWFRKSVPEEVIDHVWQEFRAVKGI